MVFDWFRKKAAPPQQGPDFSAVDSREKAEELFRRGELAKLFMMPLEFGGDDIPENTLYVPPWVVDQKAEIDNNVVRPLAMDGHAVEYKVRPEYQGRSFIPIAIRIRVSNPGELDATINIWGEALSREGRP
jgi:hypothetical protein